MFDDYTSQIFLGHSKCHIPCPTLPFINYWNDLGISIISVQVRISIQLFISKGNIDIFLRACILMSWYKIWTKCGKHKSSKCWSKRSFTRGVDKSHLMSDKEKSSFWHPGAGLAPTARLRCSAKHQQLVWIPTSHKTTWRPRWIKMKSISLCDCVEHKCMNTKISVPTFWLIWIYQAQLCFTLFFTSS